MTKREEVKTVFVVRHPLPDITDKKWFVRCGHNHVTMESAVRCEARTKMANKYQEPPEIRAFDSDRYVTRELTEEEEQVRADVLDRLAGSPGG